MIAFLVIKLGWSLKDIGALTLPQARVLVEEYARLTGAETERPNARAATEPEPPDGGILLESLYEAVKARMGGQP